MNTFLGLLNSFFGYWLAFACLALFLIGIRGLIISRSNKKLISKRKKYIIMSVGGLLSILLLTYVFVTSIHPICCGIPKPNKFTPNKANIDISNKFTNQGILNIGTKSCSGIDSATEVYVLSTSDTLYRTNKFIISPAEDLPINKHPQNFMRKTVGIIGTFDRTYRQYCPSGTQTLQNALPVEASEIELLQ